MKVLTGRVMRQAKRVVQDMHDWYHAREDSEELEEVFRNLHNALFKHVKHPYLEAHLVLTKEHVVRQVGIVIQYRENG